MGRVDCDAARCLRPHAERLQYLYNTAPFGQVASPYGVGLRIHSMRTPDQRQENFAMQSIVNEAAAAAGVDRSSTGSITRRT